MKDTLDFIVIGAQKAGTTSLFEYMRRHPELELPEGKEAPFFSHDETRARGWAHYLATVFASADPAGTWGTVTPQYMVGGLWEKPNPETSGSYDERTVPMRIREHAPEARLIAILRDPVERACSHHRMALMNEIDERPFAQAIDELLQPQTLEQARREPRETTGYVAWGEYGRILSGYLEVFPREQLLVVFTDELEHDTARLLRRLYEFVHVRSDFLPDNLSVRYRAGATERRFAWLGTYSRLNPWTIQRMLTTSRAAKRLWNTLPGSVRRQLGTRFARAAYRLDLWNRRTTRDSQDYDAATLQRLRVHYRSDTQRLAEMLDTEPPWKS